MKRFSFLALFLTMLITACGNIPGLGPVATSTTTPTITPPPTNTPTPTPTATPLPSPTATKQLTHQEQLERDYGHLVPKDEKCVTYTELISPGSDIYPPGLVFAELQLHATGNKIGEDIKTITIPWGEEKTPREVNILRVICRDANLKIMEPMWLVLGGEDFGENHDGTAVYWYIANNGNNGRKIMTVQELITRISAGLKIKIEVPVKIASPSVKDRFGDYYGLDGYSNELTNQAIRTFYDNEEIIKQIVGGSEVNQKDWVLYPLIIEVDTDLYQSP